MNPCLFGFYGMAVGDPAWGLRDHWSVFAAPAVVGLACATLVEHAALATGRWSYTGRMPVVTVVGLYLGVLIGNSVLTEIVFNRPGLGKLIVNSLNQRDYTMLEGLMVIYAFIIILVNLLTDLAYGLADPRVRHR